MHIASYLGSHARQTILALALSMLASCSMVNLQHREAIKFSVGGGVEAVRYSGATPTIWLENLELPDNMLVPNEHAIAQNGLTGAVKMDQARLGAFFRGVFAKMDLNSSRIMDESTGYLRIVGKQGSKKLVTVTIGPPGENLKATGSDAVEDWVWFVVSVTP